MHPENIKAELKKKGLTQKSIADHFDVTPTTVHHVIHGGCRSDRIAKFIAEQIGKDRSDIWPGRYEPVDERLRAAA